RDDGVAGPSCGVRGQHGGLAELAVPGRWAPPDLGIGGAVRVGCGRSTQRGPGLRITDGPQAPGPVVNPGACGQCTCGRPAWQRTDLGGAPAAGWVVLVEVERVAWSLRALDLAEPVVVAAVGGFDALLALAHHEVDVAAACRGRVQLLPVVAGPLRDEAGVGGIGVDAHDDACPAAAAVGEGRRLLGDAAGGAVDRVH